MTEYDLTIIKALALDVDGVLSPSVIPMDCEGTPRRMVNIKDGYALQLAIKKGFKIAIITGGCTSDVRIRFENLGIKDIFQGAASKLPVLAKWMQDNHLLPHEVAYMGDDIPDLQCMNYVGLPAAPADAAPECISAARYISPFNGGYGCVRDILQQILAANNLWMNDADAFGW